MLVREVCLQAKIVFHSALESNGVHVFTSRHASLADVPERQGERRTYRLKRDIRKTPESHGERFVDRLKRASRYTPSPVSECHERGKLMVN